MPSNAFDSVPLTVTVQNRSGLTLAIEPEGPIESRAALLLDLKRRGLLDDTLVFWSSEFGRTPMMQGDLGRQHNAAGFTIWMAGGGVRRGVSYGATDEFGYRAVENRTTIHDLHATMLHLLGIDHEKLTFRHNGIDRRLTDVHGKVVEAVLA